jgi:DNA-binding transcriptional LysR family regulator
VALLEKAGRGVRLTEAGRLLSHHAALLLAAAEAAQAELASLASLGGEVRGTVRAGGLQSATKRVLIPAVARARADHPEVRVEVTEIELEQALPELRLGSLDLVVSDEYDGHPRPRPVGFMFEPLHEEPLRLVLPAAHPATADGGRVSIAALREDVWAASDAGTGHHAVVEGTCRSLGGYDPDVRHRSNDADVQLELARTCGVVALLPTLVLPAADPALAIRDIAEGSVGRKLVLITREAPKGPALAGFLAAVREQAHRLGT